MSERKDLILRFRKWVVWAIALGVVLYVGGSIWAGFSEVGESLASFAWWLYVPVCLLTLVNYGLRFGKWHYLLGRLGIRIPVRENLSIFIAGLAMVISPAKAGELLKPYLVSRRTGVPMATTIPALVAERLTDGIAMLALAAISVSTYAADSVLYLVIPAVVVVLGLGVLASRRLSMGILGLMERLPLISRVAHRLEELYLAMRTCLAPGPFLFTVLLSLIAWEAECFGLLLVFEGLGVEASLDASTFLYAFATVAGGAMPGGLGVADGALVGGAMEVLEAPEALAVTAALLIRVATLWLGVLMGAFALLRFDSLLHEGITTDQESQPDPDQGEGG